MPLAGRAAIITGGNQGFGLAVAQAYVEAGARVFLCARDEAKLEEARASLAARAAALETVRRAGPQQTRGAGLQPCDRVLAMPGDVSVEADVRRVVDAALAAFGQLHILVNNAGVYGPFGPIEDVDWEEWVRAIQINVLGSVLMCRALVPHFRAQRYGKIVQLSGGGATSPLPRISAYAASKAAIVRFAETLAEEVREARIDVNAIAPGPLNTRLLDEALASGPDRVGQAFYDRALKQKAEGGAPLERGAALAVFLGSAVSDGITGRLISALWDPWEDLPSHTRDLDRSDVYTIRRIVPKDRGFSWGER